jgi:DNA-binding SARP family transcriptional activator
MIHVGVSVLAVLLLQAGRPIAREQVISAVWGEDPPARAVNLVQRHVSGLRRVGSCSYCSGRSTRQGVKT